MQRDANKPNKVQIKSNIHKIDTFNSHKEQEKTDEIRQISQTFCEVTEKINNCAEQNNYDNKSKQVNIEMLNVKEQNIQVKNSKQTENIQITTQQKDNKKVISNQATQNKAISQSLQLQDEQEQKLSYQTNKLSQYIQLQLSDLENTLHYIQKKHSLNQIKESISHSYNIFSETEPIFRQLRIGFIYNKVKKLVNCFSIIYLVLMDHVEKPHTYSTSPPVLVSQLDANSGDGVSENKLKTLSNEFEMCSKCVINRRNFDSKKQISGHKHAIKSHGQSIFSDSTNQQHHNHLLTVNKRPNKLGGVHLFNEQYNRHIESDLDRLKKKMNNANANKSSQDGVKVQSRSDKQKFKDQIFKEINSDIYGSPSPDELTLFFNLNNNRSQGPDIQLLTFQDQLQEIANFFKQSQDQALQFLNKSRDEFAFLNFKEGFKEAISLYKSQKQGQVLTFVQKVKNLFGVIKSKTIEKQKELSKQILELKRIQSQINKPQGQSVTTQTSRNYQQQISQLNKTIAQLQTDYDSLRDYHKNENAGEQNNLTMFEHKIAVKDHQLIVLMTQLQERNQFIDFLNEKIQAETDHKTLRRISTLYKNHAQKNSSKLNIDLQGLLQNQNNLKRTLNSSQKPFKQNRLAFLEEFMVAKIRTQNSEAESVQKLEALQMQDAVQQLIPFKRKSPRNHTQLAASNNVSQTASTMKRKRKAGSSFFKTPEKRFSNANARNISMNLADKEKSALKQHNDLEIDYSIDEEKQSSSGMIPLNEEFYQNENNENEQFSISKSRKNLVQNQRMNNGAKHSQGRSSLQMNLRSKVKKFEPKRSVFASSKAIKNVVQEHKNRNQSQFERINQENSQFNQETSISQMEQIQLKRLYQMYGKGQNNQFENQNGEQLQMFKQMAKSNVNKKMQQRNLNNSNSRHKNSFIQNSHRKSTQQKSIMTQRLSKNLKGLTMQQLDQLNSLQQSKDKKSSNIRKSQFNSIDKKSTIKKKMSAMQNPNNNSQSSKLKKTYSNQYDLMQSRISQNLQDSLNSCTSNYRYNESMSKKALNKSKNIIGNKENNFKQNTQQQIQSSDQSDYSQILVNTNRYNYEFQEKINMDQNLSPEQKEQAIQNYYNSLYKDKRIKASTLQSKTITVSIIGQSSKQKGNKVKTSQQILGGKKNDIAMASTGGNFMKKQKSQTKIGNSLNRRATSIVNQRLTVSKTANQDRKNSSGTELLSGNLGLGNKITGTVGKHSIQISGDSSSGSNARGSKFNLVQGKTEIQSSLLENLKTFHKITHKQIRQQEEEEFSNNKNNKSKNDLTKIDLIGSKNKIIMPIDKNLLTEQSMKFRNGKQKNLTYGNDQRFGTTHYTMGKNAFSEKENLNSMYLNSTISNLMGKQTNVSLKQKQKIEDYLQKSAIKLALKSKNLEQFKVRIQKSHQSRCGVKCKHLERYLQNFNKFKNNNRAMLKIHIQNVNETIERDNSSNEGLPQIGMGTGSNFMNTTGFPGWRTQTNSKY